MNIDLTREHWAKMLFLKDGYTRNIYESVGVKLSVLLDKERENIHSYTLIASPLYNSLRADIRKYGLS
jgi:hypothetical protein